MDGGIGERRGRGLDPHVEAFRLEPAADDRGAEIGVVARPAAPYDHCLAHAVVLPSSPSGRSAGPASSWPDARPSFRASRAGLRRPRVWNASMASSACSASAPLARCGRPLRMAAAMSATPMERNSPSALPCVMRNGLPVAAGLGHRDLAAELVGVGHQDAALRAVDLDRRVIVLGHVEAHGDRDDGAALELQRAGDMGRDLDRDAACRSSARW